MSNYTSFATDLAYKAGKIMRENFDLGMERELKEKDTSPLTIFDTAINRMVIESIYKTFPLHSIIGEEESLKKNSEYIWFCDPIDGTTPFTSGVPVSTFSLALTRKGKPILGVIYDPFMDRLFVGEKGKGSFVNKKRITISNETSLKGKPIYTGWWKHSQYNLGAFRNNLSENGTKIMDFNCFSYAGALVAAGEFLALIYPDHYPWDIAAVQILVEEAGGKCTDFTGAIPTYDKEINGFIATNGKIHDEILDLVKQFAHKM